MDYLIGKGFPLGLARGVAENVQMFEHRLWVVDNSGSMMIGDGHRILHDEKDNFKKATRGSRWEEIRDTVQYHASMAIEMESPTTFRVSDNSILVSINNIHYYLSLIFIFTHSY